MANGRHRAVRKGRARHIVVATCLLTGAGVLPGAATAATAGTAPGVTVLTQPAPVPEAPPIPAGDSCVETADSGWVCTPTVGVSTNVNTNVYIDVVLPPADATPIDLLPDPNAPIPTPDDVSVEPDVSDVSATDTTCDHWGTAIWENGGQENYCPPVHWLNGYFHVDDQTGSQWLVSNFTTYWNNVDGLSASYGCSSGQPHCVKVVEGHYGTSYIDKNGKRQPMWTALTTIHYTPVTHHMTTVSVQFNDSWGLGTDVRNETVCHELGHVAGLGHETQNVSCMWWAPDGQYRWASADDFNQLTHHTYAATAA